MTDVSVPTAKYETDAEFNERLRKRMRSIILFSIALLITVVFFFPIFFMFTSSFKAESEIFANPVHWLPHEFQGLQQYQKAFELTNVARWYFNSLVVSGVQTVSTVIFGALAGYGFAKFHFRGRNILFILILSIMAVPFQILLIPMFVLVRQLGLQDTYGGLIAPGLISALGVFMMRQFAFGIPNDLLEAARIDGANEIQIFGRIALPLLAPASASLAIITFLFSWNNFLWPLVVVQNRDLITLPVGLTVFTQPQTTQPMWAIAMAVSTLATIPVALMFIFFQRYFVEGMMVSGIKG